MASEQRRGPGIGFPSGGAGGRGPLERAGRRAIFWCVILVAVAAMLQYWGPLRRLAGQASFPAEPRSVTIAAVAGEPAGVTAGSDLAAEVPSGIEARPDAPLPADAARRRVLFHGLLESVSDYDDVAQNRAYAALAGHVWHLTEEEAKKIRRDDLGYEALVKNPSLYRGELVRRLGLLLAFAPVRLVPGAGPQGVEDAWRGYLVDTSGEECYIFDSLTKPPPVELRRDLVAVEGAFLKVVRYENVSGEERDAPFLLARQITPVEEGELERPFRYDYVAAALVGVMIVAFLTLALKKRHERELGEIRTRRSRS